MADLTLPVSFSDTGFGELLRDCGSLDRECLVIRLRQDQRARWLRGERLPVESYRDRLPELAADAEALLDLIYAELLLREELGERPALAEFQARFPALSAALARQFNLHRALDGSALGSLADRLAPDQTINAAGPHRPGDSPTAGGEASGQIPLDLDAVQVPGYEILGELGRGGMGVVYKARQTKLHRLVALKMVLAGTHAGPAELVRFLAEAEAAAALQHPNIVQIHEIGQHNRLPFFSLELCAGGSLADRLLGTPQPPHAAAGLIETLARTIQHAHERGIVHRDLKPANILLARNDQAPSLPPPPEGTVAPDWSVNGEGWNFIPKVCDFGLAKRLESGSDLTHSGAFLGTPSYMAPEQAAGHSRAAGPTADVYSLGAILYEMLTGRPPFRGVDALDTLEQARARDPVPPRQLQPKLPRDLETVCLKCLQKDPRRRYAKAAELADDLRRYLDGRPILARPVAVAERAVKWVRRQPALAALIGVTVAAVIALVGGGLWYQVRLVKALAATEEERVRADRKASEALDEQQRADREATVARDQQRYAEEVRQILINLFVSADPLGLDSAGVNGARGGGKPLSAKELIERAQERLKTQFHGNPQVRAEVLQTLGHLARTLGDLSRADQLLTEAVDLRRRYLPPNDPELATSLHHLAWLRHEQGELDEADMLFRQALDIRTLRLGPENSATVDTLLHLAWVTTIRDDLGQAEPLFQRVLALRLKKHAPERDVAIARMGLVSLYLDSGDWKRAVPYLRQVVPVVMKSASEHLIDKAVAQFQTGVLYELGGLSRLAIRPLQEARALVRQQLGAGHLYEGLVLFQLGLAYEQTNQLDQAESAWRECLAIVRDCKILAHPKTIVLFQELADLLRRRGKIAEGEALFRELLTIQARPSGGRFLPEAQFAFAGWLGKVGRPAERLTMLEAALAGYRHHDGPRRQHFAACLVNLAEAYQRAHRPEAAEPLLEEALPLARQKPRTLILAVVLTDLAGVRLDRRRTVGVEAMLLEAKPLLKREPGMPTRLAVNLAELGRLYRQTGRWSEALAAARESARLWPHDPRRLFAAALDVARCVPLADMPERRGQTIAEALALLQQAVAATKK